MLDTNQTSPASVVRCDDDGHTSDWRHRAACRGFALPETFFPFPGQHQKRAAAQNFCASCPVTVECAEFADQIGATDGVWAGVDRDKRGEQR